MKKKVGAKKRIIKSFLYLKDAYNYSVKQPLWCRFFHKGDRCYPEVWDKGPEGPWHCSKCVPCGIIFERLAKGYYP